MTRRTLTIAEWKALGTRLYGEDMKAWRWRCVACGHVQSAHEVRARNPDLNWANLAGWIYFSCEGRHNAAVGCNWTLGGLLTIHTLEVDKGDGRLPTPAFEFADDPDAPRVEPPTRRRISRRNAA